MLATFVELDCANGVVELKMHRSERGMYWQLAMALKHAGAMGAAELAERYALSLT
jgi:hypothetical protein